MFRKTAIIGTPIVLGAVAVKISNVKEEPTSNLSHYNCKQADLPIYAPLHTKTVKKSVVGESHPKKNSAIAESIESGIRVVRMQVFSGVNAISAQKKQLNNVIETGIAHSQSTINYLNEPSNTMPRVGAIAIGGLSGMILAVRGGILRKFIYTAVGAGGIASICYPKEAEHYGQRSLVEAKKGFMIAYNFTFNVKPGDKSQPPEQITKFPTSFSKIADMVSDFGKSAKDALFSSKK